MISTIEKPKTKADIPNGALTFEQIKDIVGNGWAIIRNPEFDGCIFLKGELIDSVYFQQNSFDEVDAAVKPERQIYTFAKLLVILASRFSFPDKNEARMWFNRLRQRFLDYNGSVWQDERFKSLEKEIDEAVKDQSQGLDAAAEKILA